MISPPLIMPTVDLRRPINPRNEVYKAPLGVAFAAKTLVTPNENNSTDTFTAAVENSATILGINIKTIGTGTFSVDTDVPILVDEDADYSFAVGTGTADENDEQGFIDLKDADEVDVGQSDEDCIFVTRFVSGTRVLGKITLWAWRQPPVIR